MTLDEIKARWAPLLNIKLRLSTADWGDRGTVINDDTYEELEGTTLENSPVDIGWLIERVETLERRNTNLSSQVLSLEAGPAQHLARAIDELQTATVLYEASSQGLEEWKDLNTATVRFDAALGLYRAWQTAIKEAGL